ncbi:hypothetical protein RvY_16592 [Ramazzottius varieornatus]|uniref:Tc1-like transposase DDE domain-containing protein n=1 Tax=Ramazzottius varieornatus TaxID=947166 RepID=A0A1D1W0A7_RAMVA|nr:hypothetical protein RvY_16592 [Ramazzottius varieornatus]
MKETVVPSLKDFALDRGYKTIVVIKDNATYHSRLLEEYKRPKRARKEIKEWLDGHNIEYEGHESVPELWLKVTDFLNNFRANKYYMDTYLKAEGIKTVRLPPHHCDFNRIEKC